MMMIIRQTKKQTLFDAQIYQINNRVSHRNFGLSKCYLAHVNFRVQAIFTIRKMWLFFFIYIKPSSHQHIEVFAPFKKVRKNAEIPGVTR